ncbi:zinc ABC transporter permease AztB [Mycetocola spongiae]|uniref:zinc ABC transporter permease AztB n=1 Tax=Mycetocola spongiae TaxID=2859226 RepID=UPI001CF4ABF6|nr:zinc ABC transporter permease AztB [Mycetocola spongiae]UCR88943.1 metal ABC transporter permease [Mycetocola spongiae]
MFDWITDPAASPLLQRALLAGVCVAIICALVGVWVVLRGLAFFGDAMSHGMLPGVAIAALLGGNPMLGAALAVAVMALGVSTIDRLTRLRSDTAIGVLFAGMLAAGVIIVSRSDNFAVDLTGFLFGDVLAVRAGDLPPLLMALGLVLIVILGGHRAFLALSFDPRVAHTLGLRPGLAQAVLISLVAVANIVSFHLVGTLLVFGLLIAPAATALLVCRRIPQAMLLASALGIAAVIGGLLLSWHARTAAGASITAVAVLLFLVVLLGRRLRGSSRVRNRSVHHALITTPVSP